MNRYRVDDFYQIFVFINGQIKIAASEASSSVPTATDLFKDGSKQVVEILQAAADYVPLPFVSAALTLALKAINTCDEICTVGKNVRDLKHRICSILLVIVDSISKRSMKDVSSVPKDFEIAVIELEEKLRKIVADLDSIKDQRAFSLFLFKNANMLKVAECFRELTAAMEKFNVAHELRTESSLSEIQTRLLNVSFKTDRIAGGIDRVEDKVDRVGKIDTLRPNIRPHNAVNSLGWKRMPLPPDIFEGRDSIVDEIAGILDGSEISRICILGPGGMGKTSVALAVMKTSAVEYRFASDKRFWIPCIEATSANHLIQVLYSALRITRSTYDPLEDILTELSITKDPRLLLLDNFNTPWEPLQGSQREVGDVLRQLASLPHVALLLTMRATFPPRSDIVWQQKSLSPIDSAASRRIFIQINEVSASDPNIDCLLDALGHMPFAVTLMATLAKQSGANAQQLLHDWRRDGTNMISHTSSNEENMNCSISLSVGSRLMERNPEALDLFATLSMLPAGTTFQKLDHWIPTLTSKVASIATLRNVALIMDTYDRTIHKRLFVLPVVQSYMRLEGRISSQIRQMVRNQCYKYIMDHSSLPGSPSFKDDVQAIAAEHNNLWTILRDATHIVDSNNVSYSNNDAIVALLNFTEHHLYTKPNPEIAEHTFRFAQLTKQDRHIAQSLFLLGKTYSSIDRFEDACLYFEQGIYTFQNLSTGPDYLMSGKCALLLAEVWNYMAMKSDKIEVLVLSAQKDLEKSGDRHGIALGQLHMGRFYWYNGKFKIALSFLNIAKGTFEALNSLLDLCLCLHFIHRCYAFQQEYLDALDFAKQGLKIAEEIGHDEGIQTSMRAVGIDLLSTGHYEEALIILEKSLILAQELGSPLAAAQSLELMGYIYAVNENFSAAQVAYNGARGHFSSLVLEGTELGMAGHKRCTSNIAILESEPNEFFEKHSYAMLY
ncbi:hypothetical protein BU17DRAFT_54012 [Hysterangium stoloniferum]|nr:hypothetical protein BU17DRAFT_54012 [Hysterangium stoloniferum]